jgi:hypothetical protein
MATTRADDDLLELAKERFKQAQEADDPQRERELADLRVYAGEIWTREELDARAAQPGADGMPPIPARPSLNIPLLQEPIKQVTNEIRNAELGVEITPVDDFPDDGAAPDEREIELREGLVRRIQRESEASDARVWAATRAVQAGRGYWGILTQYLPGKTWDQEIKIVRFYNQASVSLDPSHEQPDGSDAEWAFIGNDLPWDEYRTRWPRAEGARNRVAHTTPDEFRALGDDAPGWFTAEGDTRICRVVDYWYTERETRELVLTREGVFWADELPKGVDAEDRREVIEKAIKWCQIDGVQVLDRTDWLGPDIPIIKVLGEELQPYDQERRAQGMVRPAKDSIKGFAAMVSKLVETIGLTPIPPFMATPEQVEGFEKQYQLAASRSFPVLYYNAVQQPNGQILAAPARTPVDTPVQAIAGAIQLFRETIQSTTAIHDPSLGRVDPSIKSGRAIRLLQQQSQHGSSNFLDNFQRSIRREGHILNNLLYPVYGKRPGRLARIVTAEGTSKTVAINAPEPAPMGRATTTVPSTYQLTDTGTFNVVVKVGRAFESRRQEENATLGDLISSNPLFMTWFGDLFFKNADGPGHLEMAERAKVMLDPHIQQMLAQKEQGSNIPPQFQAQLMQMQQQIQEAEKVMQAQQQELQTRQGEIQSKMQIAQLSADKDIRLQQMRDATALAVAKINALTKGVISDNERQVEEIALAEEAARTQATQAHEARMAGHQSGLEHAHDHATRTADQLHELATMHLEHEHALEEQQQAADLAPEPAPEGETEPTE